METESAQTRSRENINKVARDYLAELLEGGFAPVVILLREFHFDT